MRNVRWTARGEMRGKGGEMGRGPSRRVSKTLSKPSRSMTVGVQDLKQAKSHDGGGVVCKTTSGAKSHDDESIQL